MNAGFSKLLLALNVEADEYLIVGGYKIRGHYRSVLILAMTSATVAAGRCKISEAFLARQSRLFI